MGKIIREIDGVAVEDAKRPIKIVVGADDIKGASKQKPNNCAVARACYHHHLADEVRVHLSRVYLKRGKGQWVRYLTPRDMRSEIVAFDRGGSFQPGEFILKPIPHKMKLGKRTGTSTNENSKKRKTKRRQHRTLLDVRGGPA